MITETLYDRLGGAAGIATLARRAVDRHLANPAIVRRLAVADPEHARATAADLLASGAAGGWPGASTSAASGASDLGEQEVLAVVCDTMDVMAELGYGQRERDDVLAIARSRAGWRRYVERLLAGAPVGAVAGSADPGP